MRAQRSSKKDRRPVGIATQGRRVAPARWPSVASRYVVMAKAPSSRSAVRVAAGELGRRASPVQRDLAQVADPRRRLQPDQVEQGEVDWVTLDQVFGLFRLLGHQFSPRLADLSDQRFWRMDRSPTTAP
jgi:hypothetical protein